MVRLVKRSFEMPIPLEFAYDYLANVTRWPEWAGHIRGVTVEPPGPLSAHSRGHIVLANGMKSTFVMTEFDPPRRWEWTGPFLWLTVRYDHRFDCIDESTTRLTWTVDARGFAVRVLGRLFAWVYGRNLDRAIPRLIEYATRKHSDNRDSQVDSTGKWQG